MKIGLAASRRAAILALSAAAAPLGRLPASAKVDGIPFYAPGDQFALPEAGFETFLPRTERLRDQILPALRSALAAGEYDSAARFVLPAELDQQAEVFGNMASILGDEAYTAVGIKARYRASAKKLQATLIATPIRQDDALRSAGEMEACVNELVALVPDVVVQQVRQREEKLRQAAAAAAPPPAPPLAPPEPSMEPAATPGSTAAAPVQ